MKTGLRTRTGTGIGIGKFSATGTGTWTGTWIRTFIVTETETEIVKDIVTASGPRTIGYGNRNRNRSIKNFRNSYIGTRTGSGTITWTVT